MLLFQPYKFVQYRVYTGTISWGLRIKFKTLFSFHDRWRKHGQHFDLPLFFKTFLKGKSCRQRIYFNHHFAFLTSWKDRPFCLVASFLAVERIIFKKINLSKTDLLFRFCKIGLRNTLFIFSRKMVARCIVVVVGGNFVRFWLTFKNYWSTHRAGKDAYKEKLFEIWFGNCSTPKVPRLCRFTGFTKMCNWPNF